MGLDFLRYIALGLICLFSCGLWSCGLWAKNDSLPPDDIDQRIKMAQALRDKGDVEKSVKVYEALEKDLRERPESAQLGFVLNEMSKIESGRGEYDRALALADKAAGVYRGIGDVKGESHAVNIKGLAEVDKAEYPAAERTFSKALSLSRAVGDTENEVQVLNNLGSAYYFEGKYLEAMRSYETAKVIGERIESDKWKSYWRQVTDFNQATLYQRLGRYETALSIYKKVEAASSGMTLGDRAHVEANLGTLYRRLGDPWKALEAYRKAQAFYAKDRDADGEIGVLKNIGIVYALELKDLRSAEEIFKRALRLGVQSKNRREQMQAHLYLGETLLLRKSYGGGRMEFEEARRIAEELGTPEEEWKALYGLGQCEEEKGKVAAAESLYRRAIDFIEKARVQLQLSALRAEFLGDKRNVYDALIAILFRRNAVEDAFLYLERSRSRNFQDRVTSARGNESGAVTMNEVRSRLAPGTALVEYWTAGDQIGVIWCSTKQMRVAVSKISGEAEIRELVDNLPNAADNWRAKSAALSSLLPMEWLNAEPDVRHLLIIPDNWLSLVPFELVPIQANGGELLIERVDVAYAPSAILLRRDPPSQARHFPWFLQLVAFGDPVIRGSEPASGLFGENMEALPFSEEEVHDIAAVVPGKAEVFLGAQNQKSKFLGGEANRAPLLHVSTHAFADGTNPEDSRLLFSSEAENEPGGSFVFLRELYGMDLSKVSLAVLSACDTERGKLLRGEGVQAFSRALLAAGAQSSITTLWKVDDRVTAELMKHFYYFAVERGMARGEALRETKLKFLRSGGVLENPKYWAAFVLSGEALTPVPAVLSWRTLSLGIAVPLGVVLVVLTALASRRWSHRKNNSG